MSLFAAAFSVSAVIAACCALPWLFPFLRAHARSLLLVGTLVLLGFLVVDLIPDMVDLGGATSLVLVTAACAGFTVLHALGDRHPHAHFHDEQTPAHGVSVLTWSMATHCFAGGMLLVGSYEVSARLALSVFLSLIGHKAFEAAAVSSVLIRRIPTPGRLVRATAVYVISFPLGVLFTEGIVRWFSRSISPAGLKQGALALTSLAVGSLFGCLVQDFLLPSLRAFRDPARSAPGSGHFH